MAVTVYWSGLKLDSSSLNWNMTVDMYFYTGAFYRLLSLIFYMYNQIYLFFNKWSIWISVKLIKVLWRFVRKSSMACSCSVLRYFRLHCTSSYSVHTCTMYIFFPIIACTSDQLQSYFYSFVFFKFFMYCKDIYLTVFFSAHWVHVSYSIQRT